MVTGCNSGQGRDLHCLSVTPGVSACWDRNLPVRWRAARMVWMGSPTGLTFQQLRDRRAARLGPLAVAIEHVGSTAVPGLAAKPIIDLDVVIADRTDLPTVIQRLRPLGYHHEGNLGVPGREAFTTPAGIPPPGKVRLRVQVVVVSP